MFVIYNFSFVFAIAIANIIIPILRKYITLQALIYILCYLFKLIYSFKFFKKKITFNNGPSIIKKNVYVFDGKRWGKKNMIITIIDFLNPEKLYSYSYIAIELCSN